MRYCVTFLDVRERVELIEFSSISDRAAIREARHLCAEAARRARESYNAKGIRLRIPRGYYTPLYVRNEDENSFLRLN